jgi:copper chaperone
MKTLKFKTNVKCDGCVAKIKPLLDSDKSIEKWDVDLNDPNRTMTVTGEFDAQTVESLMQQAGYKAEIL